LRIENQKLKIKNQKLNMDFKKSKAPITTITRNLDELHASTGNIYETVVIVSKRSNQISVEMKQELNRKLEDFSSYTDNLEEVFENREQIEISRFYEKMPKSTLIALQEFMDQDIYYRSPVSGAESAMA
jgi:DNA-directed RNA polymerase subunit K/omega